MHLDQSDKQHAEVIISVFTKRIGTDPYISAISFEELKVMLSERQQALLGEIRSIDPRAYELAVEQTPSHPIPNESDLQIIADQTQLYEGEHTTIPARTIPHAVSDNIKNLRSAMRADINKQILIKSGYRSPAYQTFVFLFNLRANNWSIPKTLNTVVPPGFSEHAYPPKQAIDFSPKEIKDDSNFAFENTQEFEWLRERAGEFGFELSYPKKNGAGLDFEPWHWRYQGN